MYTNGRVEDMKPTVPHYLNISNYEMKRLPNIDKAIREFSKVNKTEWIKPRKKLKRNKFA